MIINRVLFTFAIPYLGNQLFLSNLERYDRKWGRVQGKESE